MAVDRFQHFATIVYPESAEEYWIEILKEEHIKSLVSPLHNKDTEEDGTLKKEHYHVILIFESLKSEKQVQKIVNKFGGVKTIPINSLGAYSRYLCHLDETDKVHYDTKDVVEIAGADYQACCRINDSVKEEKRLIKLTEMILDNNMTYFHKVTEKVLQEHEDWFHVLHENAYFLKSVVMSIAVQEQEKKEKNLL